MSGLDFWRKVGWRRHGDTCVTLCRSLHLSEHFPIGEVSLRWAKVSVKVREDSL